MTFGSAIVDGGGTIIPLPPPDPGDGCFHDGFDRVVGDCSGTDGWGNEWADDGGWSDVTCVDGSAAHYMTYSYGDGGSWEATHDISIPLAVGPVLRATFASFEMIAGNSIFVWLTNAFDYIRLSFGPDPYSTDNLVSISTLVDGVEDGGSVTVGTHAEPSFGDWTSLDGIELRVDYDGTNISASAVYGATTYDIGSVAIGTPAGPWTQVIVGGGGGGGVNAFTLGDISVQCS